jgi:hypothetical protein
VGFWDVYAWEPYYLYGGRSYYNGDLTKIVKMDKQGRILIPASVRKKLGTIGSL